ncbi:hypothetical protein L915_19284 [Phytophthora nicotianae]|uniref:Uncharacterized protein n=1 Tax=Phytophthora nicotianae TaxID=4792 RepID=W2FSR5_PHYNI|nr:hypothetical protein L915_19284 [Phytophthora nicotianae]
MHAMTNKVTTKVDAKVSSLPMQFEMIRGGNKDKTFLECAHGTIVPFGFNETCHALSVALLSNRVGDVYTDGIEDPENARAFKHHFDFSQELGDSATLVLHAVRTRVIFVTRSLTEGEGDFKGLYTDETAWVVLRRATEATDGNDMVLEDYTRLVPVGFKAIPETGA